MEKKNRKINPPTSYFILFLIWQKVNVLCRQKSFRIIQNIILKMLSPALAFQMTYFRADLEFRKVKKILI